MRFKYLFLFFVVVQAFNINAQLTNSNEITIDYSHTKEYLINKIEVRGAGERLDPKVIILLSELQEGELIQIPGEKFQKAIEKLWSHGLFEDVKILLSKVENNKVDLVIQLETRPKLTSWEYRGLKKGEQKDVNEQLELIRGKVINEHLKIRIKNVIKFQMREKGFYNTTVDIIEKKSETHDNGIGFVIKVNKGEKVKLEAIIVKGNEALSENKVKRTLKDTKEKKWWRLWKTSKYLKYQYEDDVDKLIAKYHDLGYKDAKVVEDSLYQLEGGEGLALMMKIDEGKQYYIRNITFSGNAQYEDSTLAKIVNIKRGAVYNKSLLDKQLFANPSGLDLSALYMDNGYLFFQVTPIEKAIVGDSIDLVINIYEGNQAKINKVIITGNYKTNEHVIRRELWVIPGQKFSRSDIIQSQRAIANLGYFNPETIGITPIPHPENGTVDVEFSLEEKSTDQVELSAGWGSGQLIGTLGVSFNNFSTHRFFNKRSWNPVPHGDGQRISLRLSSTGPRFLSGNVSFSEPWLGGRKANNLTVSGFITRLSNILTAQEQELFGQSSDTTKRVMLIRGVNVSFGKKLKWPDKSFFLISGLEFQNYKLQAWENRGFIFSDGSSKGLALQEILTTSTIDQPTYPRSGSMMKLTGKATFPHSIWGLRDSIDWTIDQPDEIKYDWTEYYKFKFDSEFYTTIWDNLVLKSRFSAGYLGFYNKGIGASAFERFQFGGNPLLNGGQGAFYLGVDPVSMRIVEGGDFIRNNSSEGAYTVFNKYSMELRYPLSMNPMSTIYLHTFYEAGNAWLDIKDFNSNDVRHVVGSGVRIMLPMLGLIGFDWGLNLGPGNYDNILERSGVFFTIGVDPY